MKKKPFTLNKKSLFHLEMKCDGILCSIIYYYAEFYLWTWKKNCV